MRNGDDLDYSWREAIQSLLPVCDVVTVCDGESTDGTQDVIRKWMLTEPKIKLCVYPWPAPKGDPEFWVKWLQYGRQHCPPGWILQLDADEILHETSYAEIEHYKSRNARFSLRMKRFNFWRDAHSLIPKGVCCGHEVYRFGPQELFIPSDGEHPDGSNWIHMGITSDVEIFHYGFLRRRAAWFKKAKALQGMFFDSYDPRLATAEQADGNWMEHPAMPDWARNLVPFTGEHPELAKAWLKARNYDL